jgi:hypothetical protein
MKKIIVFTLLLVGLNNLASAQKARLNLYSGYVFDDAVDSYYDPTSYYNGTIKGGYQYGLGLEYKLNRTKSIELKYLHQNATAPMNYFSSGAKFKNFELGVSYILLGATNSFKASGSKIEPFLGGGIGLAVINIKNPLAGSTSSGKTLFAWNLKGGTNIWVTDKVGIKLNAELMSAVQSVGGGLYFGTGGGGVGLATYSSMLQFALGGGLTFNLGK